MSAEDPSASDDFPYPPGSLSVPTAPGTRELCIRTKDRKINLTKLTMNEAVTQRLCRFSIVVTKQEQLDSRCRRSRV